MALFPTDTPPQRHRRGRVVGLIVSAVAILGVVTVGFIPSPYLIEQPGPVFNTLGTQQYQGADRQLVDIPGQRTYPTSGALDMLTVSISGDPDNPPSWASIVQAWLDPSKAVVPISALYAPQESVKDSNAESEAEMTDSQQSATAAALYAQGISFGSKISVLGTVPKSAAAGVLKKGDVIDTINGRSFVDAGQLRDLVVANGTGTPLSVAITRDGVKHTYSITPTKSPIDGSPAVGIDLGVGYTFPFSVKIQLQNVGGPSAGMMFALAIIDKLTPGKLNGGKYVAGTGTITASGTVGAIGGIRQKMYAAQRAGATYFLAPKSNCDEVVGHVPAGLRVFSTATLKQSITALTAISSGSGLDALPTCSR